MSVAHVASFPGLGYLAVKRVVAHNQGKHSLRCTVGRCASMPVQNVSPIGAVASISSIVLNTVPASANGGKQDNLQIQRTDVLITYVDRNHVMSRVLCA